MTTTKPKRTRRTPAATPAPPSPAAILAGMTLTGCRSDIEATKSEIARHSRDLAALRTLEKILIERDGDFAAPLAALSVKEPLALELPPDGD